MQKPTEKPLKVNYHDCYCILLFCGSSATIGQCVLRCIPCEVEREDDWAGVELLCVNVTWSWPGEMSVSHLWQYVSLSSWARHSSPTEGLSAALIRASHVGGGRARFSHLEHIAVRQSVKSENWTLMAFSAPSDNLSSSPMWYHLELTSINAPLTVAKSSIPSCSEG